MPRSQSTALHVFDQMSQHVPAYKDFLAKNKINPKKIKTQEDLQSVPPIDKQNYLRQYPLADLCIDGSLEKAKVISVSSGSTGDPFFWVHGHAQHLEGAAIHKNIFERIFNAQYHRTLVVICFSMGTWVAGPFTMLSTINIKSNYPLNVLTPGIDKEDAIKGIKKLYSNYDKIIIAGYPPFVKDVLEESLHHQIDWRKKSLSLLLAGENFSEEWRDYVHKELFINDVLHGSVNIYGTADATILGHETPLSILIRRIYNKHPGLMQDILKTTLMPTLVQYYPQRRYFEQVGNELVFSSNTGIPLCRYNIHDTGKIFTLDDLTRPIKDEVDKALHSTKLNSLYYWRRLPFVTVNGRKDLTITIYAVLIYPENIKAALESEGLRHKVTGKFTMETKYHPDMDQYFEVEVELKRNVKESNRLHQRIKEEIITRLQKMNAEYRKLHKSVGNRAEPVVTLFEYGTQPIGKVGVKHAWVQRKETKHG